MMKMMKISHSDFSGMKKRYPKRNGKNPFHTRPKKQSFPFELEYPVRLNKFIAKCGTCSRRKAVELVKLGLITVNGQKATEPYKLIEKDDIVQFKGKPLTPEKQLIYLLLNKPKDIICTTSDEKHRKTIFDLIHVPMKERLYSIGRLDRNSTGLIVITNDGELATKLAHPSHEVVKKYEIRLDKPLTENHQVEIMEGIDLEDGKASVDDIKPLNDSRTRMEITLHIGRNRIVRRIFNFLGYSVKNLDRTYYAGLTKKGVQRKGSSRWLTPREVVMLKHFI